MKKITTIERAVFIKIRVSFSTDSNICVIKKILMSQTLFEQFKELLYLGLPLLTYLSVPLLKTQYVSLHNHICGAGG